VSELPRLAVFHNESSSPVFELFGASRDLCRIVWVIGWSAEKPSMRMLSRFGDVVDLTGLTDNESIERLTALGIDGVVVFNDPPIRLAAKVAHALGLTFHSPTTAELLSDKLAQRGALQSAGLPVPAFAAVRSSAIEAHIPFPAVLKPRAGAGSRDTFLVEDARQVADALAKCDPDEEFILEEWLPDRGSAQSLASDLVSVESVVCEGLIEHITVTGRFPFAPPFRETGSFLPSNLDQVDWDAALGLASAAIRAMEIGHGVIHTEVKMTPYGPRIIEVNGRLGGGINGLIQRLGGPSLIVWAMKLALGQHIGPIPALAKSPVAFFRIIVGPQRAKALKSVDGVSALNALPGIDDVRLNAQPGSALDSRTSSWVQNVLWITGMVASHAELDQLVNEQIASTLQLKWHYPSGDGAVGA
jgi:biotin carboxylase